MSSHVPDEQVFKIILKYNERRIWASDPWITTQISYHEVTTFWSEQREQTQIKLGPFDLF